MPTIRLSRHEFPWNSVRGALPPRMCGFTPRKPAEDASCLGGLQERVSGLEPNLRPPCFATGSPNRRTNLLELDLRAGLFELRLDLVGLFLGDALLDGLRRAFNEVLGFLEAETGDGADLLDDLDLLLAGSRKNDREFGLLFGRSRRSAAAGGTAGRNRNCSRSRDAPLLLEELRQLRRLKDGQARKLVDDLFQISHEVSSLRSVGLLKFVEPGQAASRLA